MGSRVLVIQNGCWGRIVGEDSDQGACDLCVQLCPEVFEKPVARACARVRAGVDCTPYLDRIREVIDACPSDAIRLLGAGRPGPAP